MMKKRVSLILFTLVILASLAACQSPPQQEAVVVDIKPLLEKAQVIADSPAPSSSPSPVVRSLPSPAASPSPVALDSSLPTPKEEPTPKPTNSAEPQPEASETEKPAEEKKAEGKSSSRGSTIIKLSNAYRAEYGLDKLSTSSKLNKAAQVRAKEIVESFSHTRPDGTECFTVAPGVAWGENIGMGQGLSAEGVVEGWMNSTGHRENILRPEFKIIGVGSYQQGDNYYYVQLFGY